MTEEEVKTLMESSRSEGEWNTNCDIVKKRCGGYPDFWYRLVVMSGMSARVQSSWHSDKGAG